MIAKAPIGYQLFRQASLVGARGLLQAFVKFREVLLTALVTEHHYTERVQTSTQQHTASLLLHTEEEEDVV